MTNKTPGELRSERARLIADARTLLDTAEKEKRQLSDIEHGRYHVLLDKIDRLAHAIKELDPEQEELKLASRSIPLKELELELSRPLRGSGARPNPDDGPTISDGGGRARIYSGEEIRILRPQENVRDSVRHNLPDGIRPDQLSLGRIARAMLTGNWSGAEAEQRAMGASGSSILGGYLLPSPVSALVIDLARNKTVCFPAGALTVLMETNTLSYARITQDPAVGWKDENAEAVVSDVNFGAVTLRARTLTGVVKASVELIMDAPNSGQVIQDSITAALALELDRAILRGDGSGVKPLGVRNWEGVQVIDLGTNGAQITGYSKFSDAVGKVAEKNGNTNRLATIMAPRSFTTIDKFLDLQDQPQTPPPSYAAMQRFVTNTVPINLVHGSASNASEIYVGDFSQVTVGMRTNVILDISREASDSTSSAFRNLQVWIRAYLRADVVLAHADHFVVIDGVIP